MFKDLFLLEMVRTKKEALGFYLAYLLLIVLVSGLIGALLGDPAAFDENVQLGAYFSIIACLILSLFILYKKKQLNSFGLILIAVLSGVGAIFFGGLLGLVFVAYLTTKDTNNGGHES